jgi:dihydrofolate reductase
MSFFGTGAALAREAASALAMAGFPGRQRRKRSFPARLKQWVWQTFLDELGLADRMNSLPKYVVSTTLEKVEWNNSRLIKGNITEEVKKLKHEAGQNILIGGSGDLVHLLMQQNIIDEYQLMVFPVVVGNGKRLWISGSEKKALRLVETRTFSTGVVVLSYQPREERGGK